VKLELVKLLLDLKSNKIILKT